MGGFTVFVKYTELIVALETDTHLFFSYENTHGLSPLLYLTTFQVRFSHDFMIFAYFLDKFCVLQ